MKRKHTVTIEFTVIDNDEAFDPSNYYELENDVVAQRAAADVVLNCITDNFPTNVANVDTSLELTGAENAACTAHAKAEDDAFTTRYAALEALGNANGIKYTTFSMSEVPVEEMNNPLGLGSVFTTIRFVQEGEKLYTSDAITNPTMMDAWKAFDDSIGVTRDEHHIFLEGLQPVEMVNDVLLVTFVTGS